jgi:hypothetical protein
MVEWTLWDKKVELRSVGESGYPLIVFAQSPDVEGAIKRRKRTI